MAAYHCTMDHAQNSDEDIAGEDTTTIAALTTKQRLNGVCRLAVFTMKGRDRTLKRMWPMYPDRTWTEELRGSYEW